MKDKNKRKPPTDAEVYMTDYDIEEIMNDSFIQEENN